MKALSIRQPWAWLIVNGYKPVENRSWRTSFRGTFLVHAGQQFDRAGYLWVMANTEVGLDMPSIFEFTNELGYLGGIVGSAEIYDVTSHRNAPMEAWDHPQTGAIRDPMVWFSGPRGFWLRDAKPLPFRALKGKLGFFEVPHAA